MDNDLKFREAIDHAGLLTKLSLVGGIFSAVMLVITLILGIIKADFAGSFTFAMGVLPYSLALLFSIGSFIYGLLAKSAAVEEEEKALLAKRKEAQHAFNVEEDVRFTAGRSFANYKKYAPYGVSVLAVIVCAFFLFQFYLGWKSFNNEIPPAKDINTALFVAAALMLFSGIAGAFFAGQGRAKNCRWLRPVGAWLLCAFIVMGLAVIVDLMAKMTTPLIANFDYIASHALFVIYALLGIELILNFIMEFYRPRTVAETKPIFESSILALFTEPGGVLRNFADALDYQFGFKVSGTWIYSFVERSLFPLLVFWAVLLWLFTAIVEVGPNEVGVREMFGRVTNREILQPGVYLTLPKPFGRINRISCDEIHQVIVGSNERDVHNAPQEQSMKIDEPMEHAFDDSVILWTKKHVHQENFYMVAAPDNSQTVSKDSQNAKIGEALNVSFLSMMMPIQYHIRPDGVFQYLYDNRDSDKILTEIGQMVSTEFFASTDYMQVMSTGRHEAEHIMKDRIQELADTMELGIKVVEVTLLDIHPPIEKVAPAFENVIKALEIKERKILEQEVYRNQTQKMTEARCEEIICSAQSNAQSKVILAKAESLQFEQQVKVAQEQPELYMLRNYLKVMENNSTYIRKFIISEKFKDQVFEVNHEVDQKMQMTDQAIDQLSRANQETK